MIRFTSVFYSPGEGGGGADGGAVADSGAQGSEGAVAESWHSQSEYLKANPDAAKAFSKYKSSDEALKAGHEAIKLVHGTPYRLPKDHAKLSDDNKAEINAFVNKMRGVPDAPEGYEFEMPDDLNVDDDAMAEFRTVLHEEGIHGKAGQRLLNVEASLIRRLNAHRDKVFEGITHNTFKTYKNVDCGGDADLVGTDMENIKTFLQTKAVDGQGKPDPKEWEGFKERHFLKMKDGSERMTELILLRALADAARQSVGTGGAPMGSSAAAGKPGAFTYEEMGTK